MAVAGTAIGIALNASTASTASAFERGQLAAASIGVLSVLAATIAYVNRARALATRAGGQ